MASEPTARDREVAASLSPCREEHPCCETAYMRSYFGACDDCRRAEVWAADLATARAKACEAAVAAIRSSR